MEAVVVVIFVVAVIAIGIGHLKFSKRMTEDLITVVRSRRKTEREGGDNWPNLQLEMFNFDNSEDLTSACFEEENKFCKQK